MTGRDEERRRAGLLLGGPLGRAVLADLAGLDWVRLLAAAGEPVPGGVAFATASRDDGEPGISGVDGRGWPVEWADGRSAREVIAAAVAGLASGPGQRWYDDELELLRHVAAVAEGSGFGPGRRDVVEVLAGAADLLGPVAGAVAGAPSAAWWWQPADRGAQRWLGCAHHPVLARGAALIRAVRLAVQKEPDSGSLPWPAPEGVHYTGTWWSGPVGDTVWTTRGSVGGLPAVGLACAEDPFGAERFEIWAVGISPAAKVCEIHGPGDWARLVAAHPRDVTASRRHDWHRWTGHEGPWILPDWPSVARQWDGVHVSVGGYLSTAGMRVDVGGAATLLAGWDADQTLWLNDVFTSARHLVTWEGTPGPEAIPDPDVRSP